MSLRELISEKGFDRYREGLESRFRANRLVYSITYSEGSPDPSLRVRLEGKERIGEICAWESGHCDLHVAADAEEKIKSRHVKLEAEAGFHECLAAIFRYVVKREFPNDDLGK